VAVAVAVAVATITEEMMVATITVTNSNSLRFWRDNFILVFRFFFFSSLLLLFVVEFKIMIRKIKKETEYRIGPVKINDQTTFVSNVKCIVFS
jgi:hypothetical protein